MFRVYMPNKPSKYGIKIWCMCDAATAYCANLQVYTGMINRQREVGQSKRVVLDLASPILGSGRNITADNFFSSYGLAEELLKHNLTYVGTMRKNRGEIPPEMQPNRKREEFSSTFGFHENFTLVSFL